MKIIWLNHRDFRNPKAGGAEKTIYEIGRRLVSFGHDVHLLSGGWPGSKRHEIVKGITIYRYGGMFLPHLAHPPFLIHHHEADIIIDDLAHVAPWFSPWFTAKPGIAFFRHLHARTLEGQTSRHTAAILTRLERLYPLVYNKWLFITESSSSMKDLLSLGVKEDKIVKIPPGVDPAVFKPMRKSDKPSIVYFGGMRPYKRPEHVLLACKLLAERGIDYHLTMVGDGPVIPYLIYLCNGLRIGQNVSFAGKLAEEELSRIVSSAWVNVHCSVSEGWGYSITEAAAAGTPTVAYRVPGVTDALVERKNGFLVEDGDIIALSRAIERTMQANGSLSNSSRDIVKDYSWDLTARRWESILKKLAD